MTLVDTGDRDDDRRPAQAGARLSSSDEPFCLTYGDGVADIDIDALHRVPSAPRHDWRPSPRCSRPGRFGALEVDGRPRRGFREKPAGDGGWINGGFFVLSPKVLDYIEGDATVWEQRAAARRLAREGELSRLSP